MTESDLYPGLDAELEAVYERNVAEGRAKPLEEVAVSGLETVVEEQLRPQQSEMQLASEIHEWADPQLKQSLESWKKYANIGGVPPTTEILATKNPNFARTMQRLYEAQKALSASNEKTPEGLNIGDTMHLVLIPWRQIMDDIGGSNPRSYFDRIEEMRKTQGVESADYFDDDLQEALEADKPIYRDPTDPSKLISVPEYLRQKLERDGDWGIMLVQTSPQAGLERLKGQSPDQLTDSGARRLLVADHIVDSMGVLEWIALTLQEDPSKLSHQDYSWLLANRLDVDGVPRVPRGYWGGDQVGSNLDWAGSQYDFVRPRLAVS